MKFILIKQSVSSVIKCFYNLLVKRDVLYLYMFFIFKSADYIIEHIVISSYCMVNIKQELNVCLTYGKV